MRRRNLRHGDQPLLGDEMFAAIYRIFFRSFDAITALMIARDERLIRKLRLLVECNGSAAMSRRLSPPTSTTVQSSRRLGRSHAKRHSRPDLEHIEHSRRTARRLPVEGKQAAGGVG